MLPVLNNIQIIILALSFLIIFTKCTKIKNIFDIVSSSETRIIQPKVYEKTIRKKRDLFSNIYTEHDVKLKHIQIEDSDLQLNKESNLIVPKNLKLAWVSGDERKTFTHVKICDYSTGFVVGYKLNSKVVVSVCEQRIAGLIEIAGNSYVFQPLNWSSANPAHILYKRDTRVKRSTNKNRASLENQQWMFNLTGDTFEIGVENDYDQETQTIPESNDYEEFDNETHEDNFTIDEGRIYQEDVKKKWYREQNSVTNDEVGYFLDNAWTAVTQTNHKRKNGLILTPRWLEIALAVDHTLISFHGKDKVEQYILSMMNIVSAIYQDSSLEANLKLVITKILLYENKKQTVVRIGNSKKSLENANSWNSRLHISLAPGEPRHDVAVWLTRLDIGGPSGYAPVGGACDPQRSCSLNRDEGLSSAFIIAHEMAHILGLSHDGDKKMSNYCGDQALDGSIMAPMVSATFNDFFWSDCSRKEFRKKIQKWSCLNNEPKDKTEIYLNTTLNTIFTMDEQCRMEFGDGYVLCRAFDILEPCTHLWCGHVDTPLVCKSKKGPPLEGTECGFDKWCVNGYCEQIGVPHWGKVPVILNPQDGGWGDWSPWGPCSRTCGTGVQFKSRKCNNPEPSYGGKICQGQPEEWKLCNQNTCPQPLTDFRAEQCKNLPKILNLVTSREGNMTWLPHESNQEGSKCRLTCVSEQTKELYLTKENLIDGTPCSYDANNDICVQGVCQKVGCDGQLNSKLQLDDCGVCGGDNSNCTVIKSTVTRKVRREVSRIGVFPRLSRNIKLEVNITLYQSDEPSILFIIKNRKKKKYTVTIPNFGINTQILEGAKFYYQQRGTKHNIWTKGPVLAEMVVLLYAQQNEIDVGLNISISSDYTIHTGSLENSKRYEWILGGWGPCSASCGGGRRQKTVACWDTQNQKLVRRKHCSLIAKPHQETEKCNTFDCNFEWVAGKWEPCSVTCGTNGVQYRELYCLPKSVLNIMLYKNNGTIFNEPWRFMVSPNKCSGLSPASKRECNRIPCISHWKYGEWSSCSVSCGSGITTRYAFCPPPINETFYTCGEAPPFQKKACSGVFNKYTNPDCKHQKRKLCLGDYSRFCEIPVLQSYCKIDGFRKLCCHSCSAFSLTPVSV